MARPKDNLPIVMVLTTMGEIGCFTLQERSQGEPLQEMGLDQTYVLRATSATFDG